MDFGTTQKFLQEGAYSHFTQVGGGTAMRSEAVMSPCTVTCFALPSGRCAEATYNTI
jgi:hypothetical protein